MEHEVMHSRQIKPMLWAIVLLDLAVMPALADAPFEQYHVIQDDIAKGVLENTIGIMGGNFVG